MSHGVHGFVYVLINRLIRRGVWSMLTCAKVDQSVSFLITTSISVQPKVCGNGTSNGDVVVGVAYFVLSLG
ncbi:hypothetical protein RB195_002016 [Necator americanus]|uniref:Uncharacterized protein n=1 Tax=Necator americanus TaxID=51031 RepID=A0ABR1DH71_NECAM